MKELLQFFTLMEEAVMTRVKLPLRLLLPYHLTDQARVKRLELEIALHCLYIHLLDPSSMQLLKALVGVQDSRALLYVLLTARPTLLRT